MQMVRVGLRGFDVYRVIHWWSDGEALTVALSDGHYMTFVKAERETLLQWLQQVSLTLIP